MHAHLRRARDRAALLALAFFVSARAAGQAPTPGSSAPQPAVEFFTPLQTGPAKPPATSPSIPAPQPVVEPFTPIQTGPVSPASPATVAAFTPIPTGPAIWGSAEYLFLRVKTAPIPVPLLTTFAKGSPSETTGFGGNLGVPGTTILSPDHQGLGPINAGRTTVGFWLDRDGTLGFEASGFLSESRSAVASIQSDLNGSAPLRVPFYNTPPGAGFPVGESSFVLAFPGFANGGQILSSSMRLWGAESRGIWRVVESDALNVSFLGGFKYLDLQEGLTICDRETPLNPAALGFANYAATDWFGTRNQFYGGQLGTKAEVYSGRYFASLLGAVSLGSNHQTVTVDGSALLVLPGKPGNSYVGGLFSQASNIGRQTDNVFAVIPEAQLRLGAYVTRSIRIFGGYDVLYVSDVVRPGNQIDRTLNLTGNGALTGTGTPLPITGASRPQPLFNHTDFWVQGITFGLEFRY